MTTDPTHLHIATQRLTAMRAQYKDATTRHASLKPLERQVLALLAAHTQTKEIAALIGRSTSTVDNLKGHICRKMGDMLLVDILAELHDMDITRLRIALLELHLELVVMGQPGSTLGVLAAKAWAASLSREPSLDYQ
jgi:DNA-binding CsgD family transcriptional regulator